MVMWKEAWCPAVTLVESPSPEPSVEPEIQACIGLSYDPSKCETECYPQIGLGVYSFTEKYRFAVAET